MSDLELFSMPLCPFAHRVRLVLAEKAIAYRLTEIDLRNKPQAFLKVSPHGKVPALRHSGYHICESAIINEYLDETFPERPLLPRDPAGSTGTVLDRIRELASVRRDGEPALWASSAVAALRQPPPRKSLKGEWHVRDD